MTFQKSLHWSVSKQSLVFQTLYFFDLEKIVDKGENAGN